MIEVNIIDYYHLCDIFVKTRVSRWFWHSWLLERLKRLKHQYCEWSCCLTAILTTYIEVYITVILMNMFVQFVQEDGPGLGLNKYLKNPMSLNAEVSLVWQPYHIHLVLCGEYSCQTKITDINLSKWQSDTFCGKTCLVCLEIGKMLKICFFYSNCEVAFSPY